VIHDSPKDGDIVLKAQQHPKRKSINREDALTRLEALILLCDEKRACTGQPSPTKPSRYFPKAKGSGPKRNQKGQIKAETHEKVKKKLIGI